MKSFMCVMVGMSILELFGIKMGHQLKIILIVGEIMIITNLKMQEIL